ncbi:MAG: L-alanine-DL-glutamate epimerase [Kiritimatiellae bacterium]|nr:L-alanine-DL-glutamate epimerase [Kiritimatiellia bacterium]
MKRITITAGEARRWREPLVGRFGFKGGSLTELWQSAVRLGSAAGGSGLGLGTQSVLWSDAGVFAGHSEEDGNRLMYTLTEYAVERVRGRTFSTPFDLCDRLFRETLDRGRLLTGRPGLRPTFALNALVAVDNAVWSLYARENGFSSLGEAIAAANGRPAPSKRRGCVMIPLLSYGTSMEEISRLAAGGCFFFKIKIGQPGDEKEMLAKDFARVAAIHEALRGVRTAASETGGACYYFDANGRYSRDGLMRFVDHLAKIGALDSTLIVEEPFDEADETDVSGIPLRIAADESAHTVADAERRMDMGYRAMALKPIAKTMSMSLKIAEAAAERGVPCFCADLTVNPTLVEWNRAVAEILPPFPGLGDFGLLESNGEQNYRNWEAMKQDVPAGGLFAPAPRVERMFE